MGILRTAGLVCPMILYGSSGQLGRGLLLYLCLRWWSCFEFLIESTAAAIADEDTWVWHPGPSALIKNLLRFCGRCLTP